mgnify:CR=1 FL=1
MNNEAKIVEILSILKDDTGTWITIFVFGILISIILHMIIATIINYISVDKKLKSKEKEKESTDKVNKQLNNEIELLRENKQKDLGFIIALAILIVMSLILMFLTFGDIYQNNLKIEIETDINNKISYGYEVYLDYGDGREKSKIENYSYNKLDNITINDETKEIILRLR